MKIKVLQFKPILGEVERNIKTVKEMMFNAVAESPDVIVLPELWSTGFYPEPIENFADKNGQNTCELLSAISKKYKINIVGGTTIVENDGQFYNRCFVFNRCGETGRYSSESLTGLAKSVIFLIFIRTASILSVMAKI